MGTCFARKNHARQPPRDGADDPKSIDAFGHADRAQRRYYAQRASFGLIVCEGTQPSDDGHGYLLTPGVYTEEHIAGWRLVADRLHAAGGRLFIQLMHVGRISHPDSTVHHRQPVAPSAVRPAGKMMTAKGLQDLPEPRELSQAEIETTIRDYRHAARTAIAAGADGVELHGANGPDPSVPGGKREPPNGWLHCYAGPSR